MIEKFETGKEAELKVGDVVGVNSHGVMTDPGEAIAYELRAIEEDANGSKIGVVWVPGDELTTRKFPLNRLINLKQ